MKNINFSDWQDLSLKKDIEDINRILKKKPVVNIFIMIEIIIGILTVGFSTIGIISSDPNYLKLIIVLIIVSLTAPLVIFIALVLQKSQQDKEKIKNKNLDMKPYIDIFDNKVTSYIMMATSMMDNIKKERSSISVEVKYFILSESSYLINKCINELYRTGPFLERLFTEKYENRIAPSRLHMAIKLMMNLRYSMKEEISEISPEKKDYLIENYLKDNNHKSDNKMDSFITNLVRNSISNNIVWPKWND
jgi:hypothetical protein